ncbi:MAG: DHH family phosphoesterase [Thaumarchaeota archaeon]|nr:DHH family phosphoesterase [Nitrososphaerota archaeon]
MTENGTKGWKIPDLFREQLDTLKENSVAKITYFAHRQADPDAICAAAGLSLLVQRSFPDRQFESLIILPQGASVLGEKVSSIFGLRTHFKVDPVTVKESDLIVVVDSGDRHLLEPYLDPISESSAKKIVIDHHASSLENESWKGFDYKIIESKSTSTCEIIALGFPPAIFSREICRILLTGLMFDSQHLGLAGASTLEAALILVNGGAEIPDTKKILRYKPHRSEILARLKASQRLQFEECNGRFLVKGEVSSFQASVARMLVDIGADVGIAFGESNAEARLSARSTQSFYKETGIDLAEEIRKVANHFGIVGGGHSTAASVSGKIEPSALANQLLQNLKGRLLQK